MSLFKWLKPFIKGHSFRIRVYYISKVSYYKNYTSSFLPTTTHCYFAILKHKKEPSLILPSSTARDSSAPKAKIIFEILWGILEGRTIKAQPTWPLLNNCQNVTFSPLHGFFFFLSKWLYLKRYENAHYWFYPKYISGSVKVLICKDIKDTV